jgi:hypothetical protein
VEKQPADAISLAVMVGKIATGEVEDERDEVKSAAAQQELGQQKRAESMTPERRAKIAKKAAAKRFGIDRQ